MEVDQHFIKEKLDGDIISIEYVPISHQLADLLTKGPTEQTLEFLVSSLVSSTSTAKLEGECGRNQI